MDRREFLKKCAMATVAAGVTRFFGNSALAADDSTAIDVVAVRNGTPDAMFDAGIEALGGIKNFVKKDQTVVLKPNMSFASIPEKAATTNPILVKRVIEQCYKAGAKKVYVIDHLLIVNDNELNEIAKTAKEAGAEVRSADGSQCYKEVRIPGGKNLISAQVHELVINSDVFINMPILKHHGGAKMTCALKSLIGTTWDMKEFHTNGLDQCIADISLFRRPTINIVDAYYVLTEGGPRGRSNSKVINPKMQFISTDIVAVDAVSLKQARQWGIVVGEVPYIKMAYDHHLGKMDISKMNIKKITV
ncbi:MAG TPA: tat (twin-arginine translocation) pathway signal sequence [Lentisphaeria bacterium]|nr:MAG: hypothetical protein A2X47_05725 [Lentisphaerae bacterium GWF2_38_69]HBM16109.1 tat (twin-arginine translocation) pathway signal sequence [Lentisphaeria bacterium]